MDCNGAAERGVLTLEVKNGVCGAHFSCNEHIHAHRRLNTGPIPQHDRTGKHTDTFACTFQGYMSSMHVCCQYLSTVSTIVITNVNTSRPGPSSTVLNHCRNIEMNENDRDLKEGRDLPE